MEFLKVQVSNLRDEAANWKQQAMIVAMQLINKYYAVAGVQV